MTPNLNPQPSTLNPHPQSSILNPQPSTLNPRPPTLNPPSSILDPQPSNLHLKTPTSQPCRRGRLLESPSIPFPQIHREGYQLGDPPANATTPAKKGIEAEGRGSEIGGDAIEKPGIEAGDVIKAQKADDLLDMDESLAESVRAASLEDDDERGLNEEEERELWEQGMDVTEDEEEKVMLRHAAVTCLHAT